MVVRLLIVESHCLTREALRQSQMRTVLIPEASNMPFEPDSGSTAGMLVVEKSLSSDTSN